MATQDSKKKKIPPMYYKGQADKAGIRDADYMSEASADSFENADYKANEGVEPWPARGVKGAGAGPKSIDKLKKKGMPRGRQAGEAEHVAISKK